MRMIKWSNALLATVLTFVALLMILGGWLGAASLEAADEARNASCLIGEHVSANEIEKEAMTLMLQGMEARQIHMGDRIDSIYQRQGE